RGAWRRGEHFPSRARREADAGGPALPEPRLISTDLTRTNLTGARLVRARLDKAVLDDADLSGADLSGARLLGTRIRRAVLTGSSWRRSALVGVAAPADLLDAPELRQAAVTPRDPFEFQLAPAAVGVAYGFQPRPPPSP